MGKPRHHVQIDHKEVHLDLCGHEILFLSQGSVYLRETKREGEIIVLLEMDVRGIKLGVIRITWLSYILYMDEMEWRDSTMGDFR